MSWTRRIRILWQGAFLALFLWLLERLAAGDARAFRTGALHESDPLSARALEPHRVVFYLIELASEFHRFYNRHRVMTEDRGRTLARLYLSGAVAKVMRSALGLLGVSAPETM